MMNTNQALPDDMLTQFINLLSFVAVQSACQHNGGCSQLCILKPNDRTCLCGVGRSFAEDGTSCTSVICILLCRRKMFLFMHVGMDEAKWLVGFRT